jgi:hypothetical protein
MSREELLRIGDEAAEQLSALPGSPAVTEEALLHECDRLLLKRLKALHSMSGHVDTGPPAQATEGLSSGSGSRPLSP